MASQGGMAFGNSLSFQAEIEDLHSKLRTKWQIRATEDFWKEGCTGTTLTLSKRKVPGSKNFVSSPLERKVQLIILSPRPPTRSFPNSFLRHHLLTAGGKSRFPMGLPMR